MSLPLDFIGEINSAIAHSSSERRGQMLRHLTDFFLVGLDQYSDEEIDLIDDVSIRLVETIEESSRALLAIRLAPLSKAPLKVLRILACDNAIEVASSILIQSERLEDSDLIECAKTKSQEHLLAISLRKTLSVAVTDVLVERGDQQIVLSTAKNPGAKFSSKGLYNLVRRSHGDDQLAVCVGTRPDIPRHLFEQLLEAASETVRAKLEVENPGAKRDIQLVVSDITNQVRTEATTQSLEYAAAQVFVKSLHQAEQLDAAKLDEFARANRLEEVVCGLSLMSEMPIDLVERAVFDADTKTLLVLSRAVGLPWETTRRILTIQAGKNIRSTAEIEQCFKAFQLLKQLTAQQILEFRRRRGSFKTKRKT